LSWKVKTGSKMKSEKGFTLIEVLVAMVILGTVGVGLLSAMTLSSRAAMTTDRMDTSRALAENQMEYVKKLPYAATYTPETISQTTYPGYTAMVTVADAAQRDTCIQKITVTITRNGNTTATLEDCKVKR
jgi:prepilin-type N-terminal cleavage/methylation domain-containing protein